MKSLILAVIGIVIATGPVVADETCVEVEIGGEKTPNIKCLNQQMQKLVDSVHPSANTPPFDASSSSTSLGGYNEAGLKQQYGPNYGKSVIPYRPTNTYSSTLH